MVLEQLQIPIVLAPLGGGPSTPALAAAVSNARGLGFLAAGYLTSGQMAERIAATRLLTDRPFGVNVFAPVAGPAPARSYEAYVRQLRDWLGERSLELGEPVFSDDQFDEKLAVLSADPVPVVSFTFGCPEPAVIRELRERGSDVWVTVTSPDEAQQAARAGANAVVAQGSEAGGHRASYRDDESSATFGLIPLLQLISAEQNVRVVASGGVMTGAAVAASLAAGADAVQMGSAFMLCPEAGTNEAHRAALRSARPTALTRAFTGRTARGITNALMRDIGESAPFAYPEVHYLTSPARKVARESGDESVINLWAGEAHQLARELPAGELVAELMSDAYRASAAATARLALGLKRSGSKVPHGPAQGGVRVVRAREFRPL